MSVDVQTEIEVQRPLSVVADYSSDPDNVTTWYESITAVEWRTSPPLAVGTRLAFEAHFLRRQLTYTYEVVEFVPNKSLTMRTAEGPFPMETTYTWLEVAPGLTRMTLRNRGEPAGFSKIVAPVLTRAMRRANRHDLALLKRKLESSEG